MLITVSVLFIKILFIKIYIQHFFPHLNIIYIYFWFFLNRCYSPLYEFFVVRGNYN